MQINRKVLKFLDAKKLCNVPKIQTFCQNDANGITNCEDPDKTASLGAVWSGSALFAHTYLSENRVITVTKVQTSLCRLISIYDVDGMSCVTRKPVWVFDQVRHKLGCIATEDG